MDHIRPSGMGYRYNVSIIVDDTICKKSESRLERNFSQQ